jgi:lysophospholipase L1-like esterase
VTESPGVSPLRYVALGDSYTIGTSVTESERWPNQLVAALGGSMVPIQLVANLGVNGFTSADLVTVELPQLVALRADFVTVLIGVNDVVQGVPEARYRQNLGTMFDELLGRLPANRILVVTTPDYTVTPAGADYGDPARRRAGIIRVNAIATEVAKARGLSIVDIFDLSEQAATDRSLVAGDGLHPSGAQYSSWVARIAPAVRGLLAGA